jgi:two-component sensor histidine kinase
VASGAALLSQEQLQALARTAKILGKGMEEVTWDVTNYLKQLQDLMPTAHEAAINEAVKQWMDCG